MRALESLRVLIVEDEGLVSVVIERLVKQAGHTVVGLAADGASALALVQELAPDVVLLDIDIPAPDGLAVARQLRETCPVPVVLLTAHQNRDLLERAAAAGVGAYLLKPPDLRELERALAVTVARFDDLAALRALNAQLQTTLGEREAALRRVKLLEGFIPICMYCKRIRDDKDHWWQLEHYISTRSAARFSHGVCPNCLDRLEESDP